MKTLKTVISLLVLVTITGLNVNAQILEKTDGVSQEQFNSCEETLELIPEHILEQAEQDKYKVRLCLTDDKKVGTGSLGRTYCDYKYITHNNKTTITEINCFSYVLADSDVSDIALLHEFGHYIDKISIEKSDKKQVVSKSYEWFNLYNEYKEQIASYDELASVNVYNSSECFAHCFAIYVSDAEWIKSNCKEIHDFLENWTELKKEE